MRIHVLLGGALMLAAAASARGEDKITLKANYPKEAQYKTQTQVIIRSQMAGAGVDATPGGPAAPVAASATAYMSSLIVIKAGAAYKVEKVEADGALILQQALGQVEFKETPPQLGAQPVGAPGVDPVLRLKIAADGGVSVLGLKQVEAAAKGASPNSGMLPAQQQAQRLLARFNLATFWVPKEPVAVGDSWPVTLAFPLPEGLSNAPVLTGRCKLLSRKDGIARLEFSGGLAGEAQVAENSGWMMACELNFHPAGGGGGTQVTGQIMQKTVK